MFDVLFPVLVLLVLLNVKVQGQQVKGQGHGVL